MKHELIKQASVAIFNRIVRGPASRKSSDIFQEGAKNMGKELAITRRATSTDPVVRQGQHAVRLANPWNNTNPLRSPNQFNNTFEKTVSLKDSPYLWR